MGNSMTFEQWAEEMKKGVFHQRDENPRALNQYDSIPSWNYDRFGGEIDEEEHTNNPS